VPEYYGSLELISGAIIDSIEKDYDSDPDVRYMIRAHFDYQHPSGLIHKRKFINFYHATKDVPEEIIMQSIRDIIPRLEPKDIDRA
jgi:hypothetical protein